MTETEKKALALVNEACKSDFKDLGSTYRNNLLDALLRAIEQHEAFKLEVSDRIEACRAAWPGSWAQFSDTLERFIIAKPDPLVEVIATALREGSPFDEDGIHDYTAEAKVIAAAIRASGHEVRKIGEKAGE